jgi:hypothetical protein
MAACARQPDVLAFDYLPHRHAFLHAAAIVHHGSMFGFVRAPYDAFIRQDSRFWNASRIDVSLTGAGVHVRTESLQAILMGGPKGCKRWSRSCSRGRPKQREDEAEGGR